MKRFVRWSPAAKAQLRAIDRKTAHDILQAINDYLVTRTGDIKPLAPPLRGLRLRVGDWRVLFESTELPNAILVSKVAHRSAAYRQRTV